MLWKANSKHRSNWWFLLKKKKFLALIFFTLSILIIRVLINWYSRSFFPGIEYFTLFVIGTVCYTLQLHHIHTKPIFEVALFDFDQIRTRPKGFFFLDKKKPVKLNTLCYCSKFIKHTHTHKAQYLTRSEVWNIILSFGKQFLFHLPSNCEYFISNSLLYWIFSYFCWYLLILLLFVHFSLFVQPFLLFFISFTLAYYEVFAFSSTKSKKKKKKKTNCTKRPLTLRL